MREKTWEPFRCDVMPERDAVRVVPVGELDLACAGSVETQLQELFDAGFGHVVLDLHELTFMDSTGLRTILTACREAEGRSIRFTLVRGGPDIQRVFEITGTDGALFGRN